MYTLSGNDRYSAHVAHGFVIVPTPWREEISSRRGIVGNLVHPFDSLGLGVGKVSRPFWDKALKCIKIHFFYCDPITSSSTYNVEFLKFSVEFLKLSGFIPSDVFLASQK